MSILQNNWESRRTGQLLFTYELHAMKMKIWLWWNFWWI